ncbi:MAG TPA: hypothetical protein PKI62_02795 [bacterium]|nr:hypothetical protein [bacterium]HPR87050.1 hypothetical protein [bacterium]
MKDTTKAVIRTFMFLIGAYFCYQAKTNPPVEGKLYLALGLVLVAAALMAKWTGIIFVLSGLVLCAFNYNKLEASGPFMNLYPGGFGSGLIAIIAGGFFLAVAPHKKKKDKDGGKS